jgi:hypothetical protein
MPVLYRGARCLKVNYRLTALLLRLWVRIPLGTWMCVCFECCVLSSISLCDELITRPEESYRLWCVVLCDLVTSRMRRPSPNGGFCAKRKEIKKLSLMTNFQYHSTLYLRSIRLLYGLEIFYESTIS